MSSASSRPQLLEQRLALGTYLEELLSEGVVTAGTAAVGARAQPSQTGTSDSVASPAARSPAPVPAQGPIQVRVFEVAGLTLAVPLSRVKDVVTSQPNLLPPSEPVPLLLGLLSSPAGESRVVDTARLILPHDRGMRPGVSPGRQAGQYLVLDAGHWALACSRIGDVIELQHSDVSWRTAAGKRPWLAGTVLKQMCALLDIDALIGLLAEKVA